jgi:hypothetical protein
MAKAPSTTGEDKVFNTTNENWLNKFGAVIMPRHAEETNCLSSDNTCADGLFWNKKI